MGIVRVELQQFELGQCQCSTFGQIAVERDQRIDFLKFLILIEQFDAHRSDEADRLAVALLTIIVHQGVVLPRVQPDDMQQVVVAILAALAFFKEGYVCSRGVGLGVYACVFGSQ